MYKPATNSWAQISLNAGAQPGGIPLPALAEVKVHWSTAQNALYVVGGTQQDGYPNHRMYKVTIDEGASTYTWVEVKPANFEGVPGQPDIDVPFQNDINCAGANVAGVTNCNKAWIKAQLVSDDANNRFFLVGGLKAYFLNPTGIVGVDDDKIWMYDIANNVWKKVTYTNAGPVNYDSRVDMGVGYDPTAKKFYVFGGNQALKDSPFRGPFANVMFIGQLSGDNTNPSIAWTSESTVPITDRRSHNVLFAGDRLYSYGGIGSEGSVKLWVDGTPTYPGTLAQPDPYHDPATDFWQYVP